METAIGSGPLDRTRLGRDLKVVHRRAGASHCRVLNSCGNQRPRFGGSSHVRPAAAAEIWTAGAPQKAVRGEGAVVSWPSGRSIESVERGSLVVDGVPCLAVPSPVCSSWASSPDWVVNDVIGSAVPGCESGVVRDEPVAVEAELDVRVE